MALFHAEEYFVVPVKPKLPRAKWHPLAGKLAQIYVFASQLNDVGRRGSKRSLPSIAADGPTARFVTALISRVMSVSPPTRKAVVIQLKRRRSQLKAGHTAT
jgi:hypothetical protein